MKETDKLEFKSKVTSELYKEIIAFANTEGGILVVGMNDDGTEAPLENIDEVYLSVTNGIRDNILPDVTMFIKTTLHDNKTIQIEVGEGSRKPYYLKSKGLKSSGVYMRQGTSSAQITDDAIRQMIKESDGDVFEEFPASNQNLTFNECKGAFIKRGIQFEESKFDVLGIYDSSREVFTNLGLLLSDQCQHTIKIAVFEDTENTIFKGRKEFSGSLLKQIDDAFDYIELNNNIHSQIKGLVREDFPEYPTEALREALLNAVIHRSYDYSASIHININSEFIEFISIGGLMPGLKKDEMLNGVSMLRNKKLAAVFLRLKIIEAYGTGVRRIFSLYQDIEHEARPKIVDTQNSFKIILYNMVNHTKVTNELSLNTISNDQLMTAQEKLIYEFLEQHEIASDKDIENLLNVKKTRAFVITKQMTDKGLLKISGRGASRKIMRL